MSLMFLFIFLSSMGIMLALAASFLNLFSVKWALEKEVIPRNHYSSYWHFLSGMLRLSIFILIVFTGIVSSIPNDHAGMISLIYANLAFTGYNIVYNVGFNHSFFYTGSKKSNSGSFMDKVFGKAIIGAEGVLLLFTLLWYPLNLVKQAEFLYGRIVEDWVSFLIAIVLIIGASFFAYNFYKQKF